MPELPEAFFTHAQQLQEYLDLNLSEADTRAYLIDPVLHALGYIGVGDIRREVTVPATKEFLDYELYADGKAQAIVEAKALRHQITDQAAAQCVQYAAVLGVRWCIITNGVTWSVYNAHATGPLTEKRVASIRLDGDEASLSDAWDVLTLFSKHSLAQANPLTRLLAERVIIDELSRPDSPAVAALRKAVRDRFGERVTAQTVVDVVERMRGRVAPRPNPQAELVPISPETAPADSPALLSPGQKAARTRKLRQEILKPDGTRITLEDLVTHGLVPPEAGLEAHLSSGLSFVARIRGHEIEVGGQSYPNLSAAAAVARGVPAMNGWLFWSYQGTLLNDLRQKLASDLAAAATG